MLAFEGIARLPVPHLPDKCTLIMSFSHMKVSSHRPTELIYAVRKSAASTSDAREDDLALCGPSVRELTRQQQRLQQ